MNSTILDDLKCFKRSWVHHTGMQLATLTVLGATFSVVVFVLLLSMNFNRILASWGDGVQMAIYLHDDLDPAGLRTLKNQLHKLDVFKEITYVPQETATANFKKQMASYAPDLLSDADFANPFPASLRLTLKNGVASDQDVSRVDALAATIQKLGGVEDVSYGQSWIRNYSSFVSTLYAAGGVMAVILLFGSLFVVGNSIRASIASRREEVEILELVGATSGMIRRPFVIEGLAMCALASASALILNFALHTWLKSAMSSSIVLARIVPMISYLDLFTIVLLVVSGAFVGAFGAWISVRGINDGWSAKQGLET